MVSETSLANDVDIPASAEQPGCTPFARQMVCIGKQEYIQLKWDANYWRTQFSKLAIHRERDVQRLKDEMAQRDEHAAQVLSEFKAALEKAQARIEDLAQRLFGRKSEKPQGGSEKGSVEPEVKRVRGQQRGQPGHGRVQLTHLPAVTEVVDLPESDKCCPCCKLPLASFPGTEDSEVIEIDVKAYRRVICRKRYQPNCQCAVLASVVTAPVPPKLIPKGKYGVSIWTELILDKFLYGCPTHRLLQSWEALGLHVAQGTVTGGFATLAPLFVPLVQAFQDKQRTDLFWHADETGWKVFERIEGKKTQRWYLWVYRSESVIYFDLEPSRAATVPQAHFKGLSEGIVICDRYSAYKKMARILGLLLAFCWAHVRRDFLTLAQGYPQLEQWALAWVERIGTLYHLNSLRLDAVNDAVAFAQCTATVERHLQCMSDSRDLALQDATLHEAAGKVMTSLHNHWNGLTVFVAHPEIPLDNNRAENAVRGPVVGRKNYYGSGSIWAAHFAASMFTVLLTLEQLWGINPRLWMTAYLQACAACGGAPQDMSVFLPWSMTPQRLAYFGGQPPGTSGTNMTPLDTS